MFKKLSVIFLMLLFMGNALYAQTVGESRLLWVHNYQFFQYDYKIGATLAATGENCDVWVENNLITAITVDETNGVVYAGTKRTGIFSKGLNETTWTSLSDGHPNSSRTFGKSPVNTMFVTSDGTVLAGLDDGIYRWDVEGARWRRATVRTPVFCFAEANGIVYAGLGGYVWADDGDEDSDIDIDAGVYASDNGGTSWDRMSNGLPKDGDDEYLPVNALSVVDGSVMAATEAGVFLTKNQGAYWQGVERKITATKANTVVNVFESTLDEAKLAELGRALWDPNTGEIYDNWFAVDGISREDKVVLVEYDSLDQPYRKFICPPNDIETTNWLYEQRNTEGIVGDEGLWNIKINDNTQDFTTYTGYGPFPGIDVNDFKFHGESAKATIIDPLAEILIVVSYPEDPNFEVGGKFINVKYTDGTNTWVWTAKSTSLRGLNNEKKGIIINNDNLVSGEEIENYDEFNTTEIIGQMELYTSSGLVFNKMAYAGNDQVVYAGNENGVYKTSDMGLSWDLVGSVTEGLENIDIQSLTALADGSLYAGTMDNVFKSTTGGTSWEALGTIDAETEVFSVNVINNTLYAGTPYGFYETADNGATWTGSNFGMPAYVNEENIQTLINYFDNSTPANPSMGVYDVIAQQFGEENIPDMDKNNKISILLHNIEDIGYEENLTSNGLSGTTNIAGYFRPEDQNLIGNTNKGEFLYIDSRQATDAQRAAALGHQLLRLMHWNNDYDEQRWVTEGIGFMAERLCGFPLPSSMPDFQTLTGAANVYSLVAGTALSPWSVSPDDGDMNNRFTQVSMFFTYLFENFGGFDLFNKIIADEDNGWEGIQNVLQAEYGKNFDDVYAAWVIANCINDVNQSDPISGAKYGYQDSLYSAVLNNYMDEKGLGMNYGNLFGHNSSMSEYKEYKVLQEYGQGLNNWAYTVRYLFPDPSIFADNPVQSVINYWDKDLKTGEPINMKINASDYANLRVHLIKVKPDGSKDVENITSLFNEEKELSFNVLDKYEPNADKTSLKYHEMYVVVSNQDSLGRGVKYLQLKDVTPPEVDYQIVHNPLYPEFVDILISANEHTFSDIGTEFENPTVEMVYFTDTTAVDISLFDNIDPKSSGSGADIQSEYFVYKGRYHLTEEGQVSLVIRKLQDCAGNDNDEIVAPLSVSKALPKFSTTLVTDDENASMVIPANTFLSETYLTLFTNKPDTRVGLQKSDADDYEFVSDLYQFGPVNKSLNNNAALSIKYSKDAVSNDFGLYRLQNDEWISVPAMINEKQGTISASVNELGVFAVISGNVANQSIETEQVPTTYAVYQNYPNPFNPTTEIKYQVPQQERVVIRIYNMNGQLVNTLVDQNMSAGYYTAKWNGLNARGARVSSGVYVYEMRAGSYVETRKMVLIK